MEVLDPIELVKGLKRVEIRSAARVELMGALESLRRVRSRTDAAEVALSRRLQEITPLADRDVAAAARRSQRHADRVRERARITDQLPVLGELLTAGELSGEHIDAVSKALKVAPETIRGELAEVANEVVAQAAGSGLTPEELAERLASEAKRLEADDGVARLERQRRATRVRTWTDKGDGMFRISGWFDPLSGAVLHGRFQAAIAAMFADGIPESAPDDPGERQDYLRGLALLALTGGQRRASEDGSHSSSEEEMGQQADVAWAPFATTGPPRFGRAELIVVVDETDLDAFGNPTVDWGIPISVPFEAVEDLSRVANVFRIVVDGKGGIVSAPGELDLGRSTRLASKSQRRAMRALYKCCPIPGCRVPFEFTKLHHVMWWRHGGPTDFFNLLPLCTRHHVAVHAGGLVLSLGLQRQLTITFANGQVMTTGPPKRSEAA
jgi:Domain of unknown function (DUF222)